MKKVILATDGSCEPNPGPGGWCAILVHRGLEKVLTGGAPDTTNNRMELTAVLEGIKALTLPCEIEVITDSQGVIGWMTGTWRRKNVGIHALCQRIDAAITAGNHSVTYSKVKGHDGHALNERADKLAYGAKPK